jgi:hypothetical protein
MIDPRNTLGSDAPLSYQQSPGRQMERKVVGGRSVSLWLALEDRVKAVGRSRCLGGEDLR